MLKKFIECGEISSTHGVKGEVRITPWTDDMSFLKGFKRLYKDNIGSEFFEVASLKPLKTVVVAKFKGVDTIEDARALRGTILYIDRNAANIGEKHFVSEILGAKVMDFDTKEEYGTLTDVLPLPANDVWQITKNEKNYLLPAIDEVVLKVNVEEDIIYITPMKGIFDNED